MTWSPAVRSEPGTIVLQSEGPRQVGVPDLSGLSRTDAKDLLESLGLHATFKEVVAQDSGSVYSQSPRMPALVTPNSFVTVYMAVTSSADDDAEWREEIKTELDEVQDEVKVIGEDVKQILARAESAS